MQADPLRAPARAQDLTLRHRVREYRAGDLERVYPSLDLEEGFFINHGFLSRADYLLMLPRAPRGWSPAARRRARAILDYVRDRGAVHPREVDAHFPHGKATNYWGRQSNATTHMMLEMQYYGLLRIARRESGIRVYAVQPPTAAPKTRAERAARLDRMVDIVVGKYAPLPAPSLTMVIGRLRYAAPDWETDRTAALERARRRLAKETVDGVDWYWPADEQPDAVVRGAEPLDRVRLLSPFDPIVWDRRRFELFWGWAYRFEAYTPAAKRKLGHYALPLLWRDRVVGWATVKGTRPPIEVKAGFIGSAPRDRAFRRAFDEEVARLERFLS